MEQYRYRKYDTNGCYRSISKDKGIVTRRFILKSLEEGKSTVPEITAIGKFAEKIIREQIKYLIDKEYVTIISPTKKEGIVTTPASYAITQKYKDLKS